MRPLRHFFTVIVLTLMLATAAYAGDMHTTITPPPLPGGTSATTGGDMTTGVAGDITTGNADAEAAGGSVTAAAVALIQSVLSLF
jgi:hypothetical protein